MKTTVHPSRLLRGALLANALFSALSSVFLVATAGPAASYVGILSRGDMRSMGFSIFVFSLWVFWLSTRELPSRWQVLLVIALDLLWVLGTVGLLLSPPAGLGGKWAIALVGDAVAILAVVEIVGFRRYVRRATAVS